MAGWNLCWNAVVCPCREHIFRQSTELVCRAYGEIYAALSSPANGYKDPEQLVPRSPKQVQTLLSWETPCPRPSVKYVQIYRWPVCIMTGKYGIWAFDLVVLKGTWLSVVWIVNLNTLIVFTLWCLGELNAAAASLPSSLCGPFCSGAQLYKAQLHQIKRFCLFRLYAFGQSKIPTIPGGL